MKLAKLLSLLLALAMVFALVGCGSDSSKDDDDEDEDKVSTSQSADDEDEAPIEDSDDEEDEDKDKDDEDGIVGTWVAEIDVIELMGMTGEEIPESAEDLECIMEMSFKFDKKGKVSVGVDTSAFGKSLKKLMNETMAATLADQYDMTVEELEEETGMTIDEIFEQEMEMSLDDYVDELVSEFEDSMKDLETEGEYEFDGKTLEIDGDEVDFELDGDTLVIEIPDLGEIEFERD